jgi:DNA ligase (NAD+)
MDRMEELVKQLNKFAYEYYVLDNPTISDKEYDKILQRFQKKIIVPNLKRKEE